MFAPNALQPDSGPAAPAAARTRVRLLGQFGLLGGAARSGLVKGGTLPWGQGELPLASLCQCRCGSALFNATHVNATEARPAAKSASRSSRHALLMPRVNTGSLYRCGKRT